MKIQKFHWDSHKQYLYEYDIPDEEILNEFGSTEEFLKLTDSDPFNDFVDNFESVQCYVSDTYQIEFDENMLRWETSCFKAGKDCLDPEGELLIYA